MRVGQWNSLWLARAQFLVPALIQWMVSSDMHAWIVYIHVVNSNMMYMYTMQCSLLILGEQCMCGLAVELAVMRRGMP